MIDKYGFNPQNLLLTMAYAEVARRDEEAGPFEWVHPSHITGLNASELLARNLTQRERGIFDAEEAPPEMVVCSYLESCVRHYESNEALSNLLSADDVMSAAAHIMIDWGSSLAAHGFMPNLDLLDEENASVILDKLEVVYDGLKNDILRQNVRFFVGEHFQTSGMWKEVSPAGRFGPWLSERNQEFIGRLDEDELRFAELTGR